MCSQPDWFRPDSITDLSPAQQKDREKWAGLAYFGLPDCGRTLDRDLPDIDIPAHCYFRLVLATSEPSKVGLGVLDRLPLELVSYIISALDISAVDQFKAVNKRAFEIVDTHTQFKVINSQAYGALRGLRAIKISHTITVERLFKKLCESQCNECGNYGGYMYLVTLQRVCLQCFTKNDRYIPLDETEALTLFGLTPKILWTLPHFQSYPGREPRRFYAKNNKHNISASRRLQDSILLVDRESARSAGIIHHGSFEAMQEYVANADPDIHKSYIKEIKEREPERKSEWMIKKGVKMRCEKKVISNDDMFRNMVEVEQCCYWCRDALRCMAMLRVPWLNRKSGRDEWGFNCAGCKRSGGEYYSRQYIMSTFKAHLEEFGPIKYGMHHTKNCCRDGTCDNHIADSHYGPQERPFAYR